jgi:RNA polymerase sigma factor for flagellar operon FliA
MSREECEPAARDEGEREQRIRELLPLVRRIARRVHRLVAGAELDDLIGDGCVGLVRAVDAFDPERGVPLEHYARRLILGTMLNGVRRMDPVPERIRRTLRLAEHARYALAQQLGTLPSLQEMEQRRPALARARAHARRAVPLSLDAPFPFGEKLEPDFGRDPQVLYSGRSERARVRAAVAALPPRHRRVVIAHYYAERPLRTLVEPLRVSPQRVSQLHLNAMKRLRAALEDEAA